jgi:hypothetical protein
MRQGGFANMSNDTVTKQDDVLFEEHENAGFDRLVKDGGSTYNTPPPLHTMLLTIIPPVRWN